jgi:bacterial/archaeal transporter family-2 protein
MFYFVLALIAGMALTIQVGINSTLRRGLGNPGMAAFVSFVVGALGLALYLLVLRTSLPTRAAIASVPSWAWFGGLLGAFYVATTVIVGPRLGSATLLALVVLGQLLAALVIDHFGWIGFPEHPLSTLRILGAILLFGGVLLIMR